MAMNPSVKKVAGWYNRQASEYCAGEDRPIGGYIRALSAYSGVTAATVGAARLTGRRAPARITPWDVVLLGTATHKLTRILAKDAVTSPLRAPFVQYKGASGESELAEEVREHGGTKHAVGELLTCPFCLAQWVATTFVAGWVFAPGLTRLATSTFAGVALSDFLQLAYATLQRTAEGD